MLPRAFSVHWVAEISKIADVIDAATRNDLPRAVAVLLAKFTVEMVVVRVPWKRRAGLQLLLRYTGWGKWEAVYNVDWKMTRITAYNRKTGREQTKLKIHTSSEPDYIAITKDNVEVLPGGVPTLSSNWELRLNCER